MPSQTRLLLAWVTTPKRLRGLVLPPLGWPLLATYVGWHLAHTVVWLYTLMEAAR